MLHELLLALKGHHGGLFKHTDAGIQVVANIPFIQPSELCVLNQLCKLGTFYKEFTEFIEHYSSSLLAGPHPESEDLHGLYLKCLCQGLDNVLQDYREALLALESDVMADPHLHLSHITGALHQFQLLFPALAATIDQVVTHKAHGCYILDIVYKNSILGNPVVKAAHDRILHVCHGLLFKQLSSWMLHGVTSDPYSEFFIQRSRGQEGVRGEEEEEDDDGILGVTGRQLQRLQLGSEADSGHGSPSPAAQFSVAADLLPCYIPARTAARILFVGESVHMFEGDTHRSTHHNTDPPGTIMAPRYQEFSNDLFTLADHVGFNSIGFDATVNKIRAHAAEYLWRRVVVGADLCASLRVMKDYFLLGRGELFLAFCDTAGGLLRGPVISTTEHDVNQAFQHAARNVLIDNDSLLQRFHVTVPLPDKDKKKDLGTDEVDTGWSVMGLSYTVQWPLHIFFTPSILHKYNKMFQFLASVRRTQLDLQHCWSLQMFQKASLSSPADLSVWQLRTHMAFLVDNLQYYLQVDVIESQFKTLMDKVSGTHDFEAARLAHDHFLATLMTQSFVHMRTVSSCLCEILEQCSVFCRLLMSWEAEGGGRRDDERVTKIAQSFSAHSALLFQVLSGVRGHSGRPYLAQLLLRLDYNKFFTNQGGVLGGRS